MRLYREVLLREPDAAACGCELALQNGWTDGATIANGLRASREYREFVAPVARRVHAAYRLLFDRAPSPTELRDRIAAFRHRTGDATPGTDAEIDAALDVRPLSVEMDITNQCNIRCVMCYFSDPAIGRRRREDLTQAQFDRIAGQLFPWVRRLSLTLGTEPLIHPHFLEFVRTAKRHRVPKVYVNTNAVLMTPAMSAAMCEAGLDAVNVSLDAGTQATFERVRRGARWREVLDNIAALQTHKRLLGTSRPALSLSFVMMRSTVHELPQFVRLAADHGVPAVHLLHLISYDNLRNGHESLAGDLERANAMVAAAHALGRELGVRVLSPADASVPLDRATTSPAPSDPQPDGTDRHAPSHLDLPRGRSWFDLDLGAEDDRRGCCPFPWHFLGIDCDGDVAPCGWWFDGPKLGNLLDSDFAAIWQGPEWRRLRAQLEQHELGPNCSRCPAAGMGSPAHASSFAARRVPIPEKRAQ